MMNPRTEKIGFVSAILRPKERGFVSTLLQRPFRPEALEVIPSPGSDFFVIEHVAARTVARYEWKTANERVCPGEGDLRFSWTGMIAADVLRHVRGHWPTLTVGDELLIQIRNLGATSQRIALTLHGAVLD